MNFERKDFVCVLSKELDKFLEGCYTQLEGQLCFGKYHQSGDMVVVDLSDCDDCDYPVADRLNVGESCSFFYDDVMVAAVRMRHMPRGRYLIEVN